MKFSVVLTGTLRGMQREGPFELLATRHAEPGGAEFFSDLHLLNAPHGWPDGDYIAHLDGSCTRVARRNGVWHIDPRPIGDGCDDPGQVSET